MQSLPFKLVLPYAILALRSLRETRTSLPSPIVPAFVSNNQLSALDFFQAVMYSSKLFLVSIAALVALFVHSPTAVSAAAVEGRAPALCHVGQPNQAQQDDAARVI
ncbi:hypothetical protein B0H13DRAFT_2661156 [Mycena leptocephala]|nr:hypothetical protein B0H13DRAFT_2661156 [Mycena leptocephala]